MYKNYKAEQVVSFVYSGNANHENNHSIPAYYIYFFKGNRKCTQKDFTSFSFCFHLNKGNSSLRSKIAMYKTDSILLHRRVGTKSWVAVIESGKRLWYVGRGTYAAVIILPVKEENKVS